MEGAAKVNINEGQTLTAKVVNVAALAKMGLSLFGFRCHIQFTIHVVSTRGNDTWFLELCARLPHTSPFGLYNQGAAYGDNGVA